MNQAPTLSKPLPAILAIAAGLVIDQATKYLVETNLPIEEAVPVLPVLSLYRTFNEGIAFSMLSDQSGLMIVVMRLVIVSAVIWWWQRSPNAGWLLHVGFAMIVSGAIGNLIDRFLYGHVIDFVLFHVGNWSFAVFNFADAMITMGAVCVGFHELFLARDPDKPGD